MGRIFNIYIRDLKNILTNWVALAIISGLVILPSLYAWINIRASWDPYSNTGGIKISVVNNDKGAEFMGKELNVGKNVVDALKENDSMGWQFGESREQALDDLNDGSCYAAIIIPEDFSEKITTVLDKDPVKPTIEYIENDKLNAIAPKITDKGASAIQQNINEEFVQQVTEEIFKNLNDAGLDLKTNYSDIILARDSLYELDKKFPDLIKMTDNALNLADGDADKIKELQNYIPLIQRSLNSVLRLTKITESSLEAAKMNMKSSAEMIGNNLEMIDSLLDASIVSSAELTEQIYKKSGIQYAAIDKTIVNLDGAQKSLGVFEHFVSAEGAVVKNLITSLDSIKKLLGILKDDTLSDEEIQKTVNDIILLTNEAETLVRDTNNALYNDVIPFFDSVVTNAENFNGKLINIYETDAAAFAQNIDNQISSLDGQKAWINDMIATLENDSILKHTKLIAALKDIVGSLNNMQSGLEEIKAINDRGMIENALKSQETQLINLKFATMNAKNLMHDVFLPDMDGLMREIDSLNSVLAMLTGINDTEYTNRLIDNSLNGKESVAGMLEGYLEVISKLADESGDITLQNAGNKVNTMLDALNAYETGLYDLRNSIEAGAKDTEEILGKLANLNNELSRSIKKVRTDFSTSILPRLDNTINSTIDLNESTDELLDSVNAGLSDFYNIINDGYDTSEDMLAALSKERDKLPKISDDLHKLVGRVREFDDNYDLEEVINIFMDDAEKEKSFISEPAEITTTRLNAVPNYGSAMSPFYTVLCLWVGCLLLSSLLTVNVHGDYRPYEKFLGKYLLFATLTILQALVVTIGDFLILGCYAVAPLLFIAIGILCSMVFCAIIYTLVSVFGNVGKAFGVVLLVLQVSASGGTFPVVLNPPFFRAINPFLPFTYGIDAMRQATAGINAAALSKDVLCLVGFGAASFIVGLLLKEPLYNITEWIQNKFEESGVGE